MCHKCCVIFVSVIACISSSKIYDKILLDTESMQLSCDCIRGLLYMFSNFMHTLLTKVVLDDHKACWRLPNLATANVCKVDTSNRYHIERSR